MVPDDGLKWLNLLFYLYYEKEQTLPHINQTEAAQTDGPHTFPFSVSLSL